MFDAKRLPPLLIPPVKKPYDYNSGKIPVDNNSTLTDTATNIQTFLSANSELILFGLLLYFAVKK